MNRRDLVKGAALLPMLGGLTPFADNSKHLWQGYDFGSVFPARERLNQGPFDVDEDEGWQTVLYTTPSEKPLRNPGLGLVGYTWEEGGPSIAVREGRQTLEDHVQKMASLPFVDVLYIRCDWRNVQKQPGRLDLDPVWALTFEAARAHGLRVAFRVQLSSPNFEPEHLAMPDFVQQQVPIVPIGPIKDHPGAQYREPRYDHPAFQRAFADLAELLAQRFDGDPLVEW